MHQIKRNLIFKYTNFSENSVPTHLFICENFFVTSLFSIFVAELCTILIFD